MSNTVLILGASSSIARAVAAELAKAKYDLILAGRQLDDLERTAADLRIRHGVTVHARRFDAVDFATHPAFVADCLQTAGGTLAGVVLCQGYMAEQKTAAQDFTEAQRMIDTNYTSAVSLLNLCATHMEERQAGFICAISSVAGDRGRQSNFIYGSTKAALNIYLDGLRHRLAKVKVPVLTVKPGFVDTRMTWGLPGMFLVASPERVGRDIVKAIRKRRSVLYTPWFWWGIMSIICSVPKFVFHKTKM